MRSPLLINGDCLEIMPTLTENSVDAIVTDPPYGIGFMGKAWDTFGQEYLQREPAYRAERAGLYDQSVNANRNFQTWCAQWSTAAIRIAKPGAFMLVFGGTRTFHRMISGIEDAGWEIRDTMMWLYGSGFPKSLNIAKAIDKKNGHTHSGRHGDSKKRNAKCNTCGHWNISGCPCTCPRPNDQLISVQAQQWSGWGTALKPAWEPIIVARKPLEGTVAENVLKWGTGAMNIDASRIGSDQIEKGRAGRTAPQFSENAYANGNGYEGRNAPAGISIGRWPANIILDDEAGTMLDGQSGISKSTGGRIGNLLGGIAVPKADAIKGDPGFGDTGGASRFFYCAKASKSERGEGNNHPTVKPVSLLNYLTKLVCPDGGLILDPFMGSGSTGIAAQNIGCGFIGIEREKSYCDIANSRLGILVAA